MEVCVVLLVLLSLSCLYACESACVCKVETAYARMFVIVYVCAIIFMSESMCVLPRMHACVPWHYYSHVVLHNINICEYRFCSYYSFYIHLSSTD